MCKGLQQIIKNFLYSVGKTKPNVGRKFTSCDVAMVLQGFLASPFEPLEECSDKILTLKMVLLVSLVSARSASEIQALSARTVLYYSPR